MRPFQLFASMPPEQFRGFLDALKEKAPGAYVQALGLTAGVLKARPVFLQRQPAERRAELVRKALARVMSNPIAEEMLAVYFLECRNEVLVEWLDGLGLEHEKGTLNGDDAPPEPPAAKLAEARRSLPQERQGRRPRRPRAAAPGVRGADVDRLAGAGQAARGLSARNENAPASFLAGARRFGIALRDQPLNIFSIAFISSAMLSGMM